MRGPVGQSQKFKHLLCMTGSLTRRHSLNQGRNHHILQGRKLGQQLVKLKHKADFLVAETGQFTLAQPADLRIVDTDTASVGLVQRSHNLQQRSLTGSTGPHDADYLSLTDGQVYSLQDLQRAEALGDTF